MSSESAISSSLASRYSTALFDLAKAQGCLDQVGDDLDSIKIVLDNSQDLKIAMSSPIVAKSDQKIIMMELLKKLNISDLTTRFVGVIADNRRLNILSRIILKFHSRLLELQGKTTATVVSPQALSKGQIKKIGQTIGQVTKKNVTILEEVDDTLLGGLIVKMGSKMIDSSLKTKLDKLQFAMKGNS